MSEEKDVKGFGFKIKLSKDDPVQLPIRYLSDSCKQIFGLYLEEVIVQLNMSFEIIEDKDDYGCLFISLQSRLPLDFNSMKLLSDKSRAGDLQAREELLNILKQKE